MTHVPDELLHSFVDGEVDEQVAVHVAEHLDDCAACATRAAGLEPLAAAFAASMDPVPPAGLVAAVLAEVRLPEVLPERSRASGLELGFGVGLLVAAATLFVALGQPVQAAVRVGVFLEALGTLASKVPLAGVLPMLVLAFAFFALASTSVAAAQLTLPVRSLR